MKFILIHKLKYLFILSILVSLLIIEHISPIYVQSAVFNPNDIYARYAAVMDADNGRLLFDKNADVMVPMASTTKIMTCVIALEYGNGSDSYTTSKYASSMPDVQLDAVCGEKFTLNDLLYALMLKSYNDSAVIIAENTAYKYIFDNQDTLNEYHDAFEIINSNKALSSYDNTFLSNLSESESHILVDVFIEFMNKKAHSLGCDNTHFVTPNGLDASDDAGVHSTTAKDLATIMSYCIENPAFLSITQSASHTFSSSKRSYSVNNANAFLNMYNGIISGKTGFTGNAGYCYVCAYKDETSTYIVVLLASGWPPSKNYKWHDARLLLNWAKANYTRQSIIDDYFSMNVINVKNGTKDFINAYINDKYDALISDDDTVNVSINVPKKIAAPIKKDDIIGSINVYINDELLKNINVYSAEDVIEKDYLYFIKLLFKNYLFIDK